MAHGPSTGLALLDGLGERLGDHYRLHSVRAHLLELAGDNKNAIGEVRAAAAHTANLRERHYLTTKVARPRERAPRRLSWIVSGVWGTGGPWCRRPAGATQP